MDYNDLVEYYVDEILDEGMATIAGTIEIVREDGETFISAKKKVEAALDRMYDASVDQFNR